MDIKIKNWINNISNEIQKIKILEIYKFILNNFHNLKTEIKWNQLFFIHKTTFIFAISYSQKYISLAPEKETMLFFDKKINYQKTTNLFKILNDEKIDFHLIKKMIEKNLKDKKEYKKFWRS